MKSEIEERIRKTLDIEAVYLSAMPEETALNIAEICESTLRHYPKELQIIRCIEKNCRGVYYRYFKWYIDICGKDSRRSSVQSFCHEYGHAFLKKVSSLELQEKITALYNEAIQDFYDFFWSVELNDRIDEYVFKDSFAKDCNRLKFIERKVNSYRLLTDFKPRKCTPSLVMSMARQFELCRDLVPQKYLTKKEQVITSNYALTDPNEFFCEGFADYIIYGPTRPYSGRIGELSDAYLIS